MIVLVIVVLIIVIILCLPVSVEVKYISGDFSYKVKYAFITFYPKRKKEKKSKKGKSQKVDTKIETDKPKNHNTKSSTNVDIKTSKNLEDNTSKNDKTNEIKNAVQSTNDSDINALDTLNLALDIFRAIKKKLGKFITSIKITDLYINFQVADLDAFDCALKFGKLNIILGNVLGFLNWNFKVKKKSISVKPRYNSNDSLYDISFKVKVGFGKGLRKILVMLFKVIPILKDNDVI